jgi:hypothetical protein
MSLMLLASAGVRTFTTLLAVGVAMIAQGFLLADFGNPNKRLGRQERKALRLRRPWVFALNQRNPGIARAMKVIGALMALAGLLGWLATR